MRCFVDKNKSGREFDNVKIISAEDLQYENGTKIIVSATYDFEKIHKEIMTYCDNAAVISLETIVSDQYSRRRS